MVRFKNRYFLIQLHPTSASQPLPSYELASHSSIASLIRTSIEDNFGVAIASKANPSLSVKFTSSDSLLLIVRCSRDSVKAVWSAITFISEFPGAKGHYCGNAIWAVVGVSGTIRCSQIRAIKLHQHAIRNVLFNPDRELSDIERRTVEESLQAVEKTIRSLEA